MTKDRSDRDPVIIGAVRTPVGRHGGALASVPWFAEARSLEIRLGDRVLGRMTEAEYGAAVPEEGR